MLMFMVPSSLVLSASRILQWLLGAVTVVLVLLSLIFIPISTIVAGPLAFASYAVWRFGVTARKDYQKGDHDGVKRMRLFGALVVGVGTAAILTLLSTSAAFTSGGGSYDLEARLAVYCLMAITALGILCATASKPEIHKKRKR